MQNRDEIKKIVEKAMNLHSKNIKIANKRIEKDGYCIHMNLPHTKEINTLIKEFEEKTKLDWDKNAESFLK